MVPPRHNPLLSKRRYELLRPIGRGGFGTVYLARLLGPGGFEKMVAVKILNQESDDHPGLASRLRDEARILGLVRNQTIVQVDGLLQVQGRWGVVMEYVDGLDLHGILRRVRLPPRAALEIVGHLAMALDVAWNTPSPEGEPLHLIHRDIKPSNIKVTSAGEVKILDFGIARAEFEAREARTVLEGFGSPPYMAPERLTFRHDGPEGDIYSLGVVLFECLTRRMLYERRCFTKEDLHMDRVVVAQDVAWEATEQVSEELIHFMGDMLRFHPGERPSAEAVAQRCDALVDELKGPRLRAWARASLPSISDIYGGLDNMSGVLLVEESGEVPQDVEDRRSVPTPVQVLRPPAPAGRISSPPPAESPAAGVHPFGAPTQVNPAAHEPPPAGDQARRQKQARRQDPPPRPTKADRPAQQPPRGGINALLFAVVVLAAIAFGLFTTWTVRTITSLIRANQDGPSTVATPTAPPVTAATASVPSSAAVIHPIADPTPPANVTPEPAPQVAVEPAPPAEAPTSAAVSTGKSATPAVSSTSQTPRTTTTARSKSSTKGASTGQPPPPADPPEEKPPPVQAEPVSKRTMLYLSEDSVKVGLSIDGVEKTLPVSLEPGQYSIGIVWPPNRKRDTVLFNAPSAGGTATMTCNTRRCSIRTN